MISLEQQLTSAFGRSFCTLCGRGTTALWLALRAIWRRDGPGEVIIPDLLCETVLEGVLMAGFAPVFADVIPNRYTLSPEHVAQLVTPRTRAIVVAHLFGHIVDMDLIRQAAPGIPIIEDAVQGLGGYFKVKSAGAWGDISFISFDQNKMIGGRGGALLFDDDSLVDGIQDDLRQLPHLPDLPPLNFLLPPAAAAAYAHQLRTFAPMLLRNFDLSPANVERIKSDWETLQTRVEVRNTKAKWLEAQLSGLPLKLPALHKDDAIWRYTMTVPTIALAQRMMRGLQSAGLNVAGLYYPLSMLFGQTTGAGRLTNRLVNLAVDEAAHYGALQQMVDMISALPWSRA